MVGFAAESLKRNALPVHLLDVNGQAAATTIATMVARAGEGDEAAFAELVAAYHVDMARVAFVACGDRDLAEDAVQSAWLVAWKKLHSLRDPERVRSWLLAVAANEARQIVRRRHGPVVAITLEASGDDRSDPANGIERVDLRRALGHLAPEDRALLAMRYVVDLGSDELGAATGMSPSGARAHLCRIVDRLRKELRDG
jgi:RNA polymerase sigma-70 factor, ECF subfamily